MMFCLHSAPCLFYHRIILRITPKDDVRFDAWLGAVLRNNLLYAAEQIVIPEENISLYQYMNRFTLEKKHPLYKELNNGFPLPYYLFLHCPVNIANKETSVKKNEIISFSLMLIGSTANYFQHFIEALRFMCSRGFGIEMTPFELLDVYEVSKKGEKRLLAVSNENIANKLSYPISISNFTGEEASGKSSRIAINFESPVCLIKPKDKDDNASGYQEKLNAFPSFYQLARTAAYRFTKLNILYACPDDLEISENIEEKIEEYLYDAAKLTLESAEIKHISLQSSKREGTEIRIPLRGYVGNLVFKGKYEKYLPLLKFMEQLGVGHELTYGLGKYEIK